ncbi:MAG: hypothetical protein HZB75_02155 [Candidatus Saccharibacteria bacterium]|nr:MAG: hypothetical protein HZB75_02155 [Candidatus Saccharibacteria bacterium]
MAKFLRDLLDAEEPVFSVAIRQLEQASGRLGADARLIGEITQKTHNAMRLLNLDPAITTGREFYQALLARIHTDNERLTKLIGATDSSDVAQLVPLMIDVADKVDFNRKVFVVKHDKAKELLRAHPPVKLMERLGYHSIDDMFAGEDFDELYTALRFSEGADWLNDFNELFKTVTPDDYEERNIRILAMDHDKYVDLAEQFTQKKLHNVTHTKELGVIVVVPLRETHSKGLMLKTLPLLLHYLNEVKLYSTFFKLKAQHPGFGETVVNTLIADPGTASQMAGRYVHWRVIQRYYGKLKDEAHKEMFEPHVHPEDLHWRRAEELLYQIDPEMKFWQDNDYVGLLFDDKPVTLNFVDMALSYANGLSYEDRLVYHFRESLWNEIFICYMRYPVLEQQILQELDNDMVAPELLEGDGKII